MYGDFILESSPSTFNDSIRAYKVICYNNVYPSHFLGTALPPWNRGRPVQEVLARRVPPCPDIRGFKDVPASSYYPPIQYCSDVDIMLAGISDGLMTLATEAMLSLNAVMLKIRTLEATYIANKFMDMQRSVYHHPETHFHLQYFQHLEAV